MTLLALLLLGIFEDPQIVDIHAFKTPFGVFSDGKGHYIVVSTGANESMIMPQHLFYGDGKVFHNAHAQGGSVTRDDPRYPGTAGVRRDEDDPTLLTVRCGDRHTDIKAVSQAEHDEILAKAVFKRTAIEYEPYSLARDDNGVYYYVDRGRFTENAAEYRVWSGPRGNMKPMKLTNVVHDSAGDIFATAKGDLRLITGNPARTEWWAGKNKSTLTNVPTWENLPMIYKDLGPYKNTRLGTQCDDF